MQTEVFPMRSPCQGCGFHYGRIAQVNGQDTVHCGQCGRWCYNAPRTETGRRERSVSTAHAGIKPGQRTRIIERATGRCELCGATGNLHAGHILSVEDGTELFTRYGIPITERDLNSDENLAALCEACNLGMGGLSFSPRNYIALLWRRIHANGA